MFVNFYSVMMSTVLIALALPQKQRIVAKTKLITFFIETPQFFALAVMGFTLVVADIYLLVL